MTNRLLLDAIELLLVAVITLARPIIHSPLPATVKKCSKPPSHHATSVSRLDKSCNFVLFNRYASVAASGQPKKRFQRTLQRSSRKRTRPRENNEKRKIKTTSNRNRTVSRSLHSQATVACSRKSPPFGCSRRSTFRFLRRTVCGTGLG